MELHSKHHHIDTALLFGLAVLSVVALSNISKPILRLHTAIVNKIITMEQEEKVLFNADAFSDVSITGKAYVVYDIVDNKIISSKNATTTLPLASITKVMTAFTAYSHLHKDTYITISPSSIDDDYDLGLRKGQSWKLNELLKYTLVFSSNDGAQAIADSIGRSMFVNDMNQDALSLGLNLHFTQPAGLDENGKIGGLGTALDIAKLFAAARKQFPEILDATTKARANVFTSTGSLNGIPNTNQVVTTFSGIEASKTGFTDLAGGNLAVIADITIGHPVVIVVLGSTREDRFTDVEKLYSALQKSIAR